MGRVHVGCAPLAQGGHVIEKRREQRVAPHRGWITHEREVTGCKAILDACRGWRPAWTAYALATAYPETAHTMQPTASPSK